MDEFQKEANILGFQVYDIEASLLNGSADCVLGYPISSSRSSFLNQLEVGAPSFVNFLVEPNWGFDTS
jgi:hypothetical protein